MEFGLMVSLGFFGSFGHCLGMCGPLSTALLLSDRTHASSILNSQFPILNSHLASVALLNLGRLISYVLVGAAIGGVGNMVMTGGAWAGIGSELRRGMAIVAGGLLIWAGLLNVMPEGLPKLPLLHSGALGHGWLSGVMGKLTMASPLVLGLLWGLMPCGFLYVAQIKAAESIDPIGGARVMLAFGLGTMPMMLGVGSLAQRWSQERRSQLFRLAGWVTIAIGVMTLFRNSEMVDWTGHGAIALLMLALIAGPLASRFPRTAGLLTYRRAIGVGACVCAVAHTSHMLSHSYNWNVGAIAFLHRPQQWGMIAGFGALGCLLLPAMTSFDGAVRWLGQRNWRRVHLLSVPGLGLAIWHTVIVGSHYLGNLELMPQHWNHTIGLAGVGLLVITVRIFTNHRLKS